jgi:hypothetical protein
MRKDKKLMREGKGGKGKESKDGRKREKGMEKTRG